MLSPLLLLALGCPLGDLASDRPVSGKLERGDPPAITRGATIPEGAPWDGPGTVVLPRDGGYLVVDLGEARSLRALALQADNNDSYVIERAEGGEWVPVWTAGPEQGRPGLRTRYQDFDPPVVADRLRISARGGDGLYSVARIRAYCTPPEGWPGAPSAWNPIHRWRALDESAVLIIKGSAAGAGALLLLAGALLARRGRDHVLRRTRDGALAALGVISFACFFNLFHFHFENYPHYWDAYHYYLGSKYLPELGYTRLYECTTAAEAEIFGREAVERRRIRDLVTNEIESAAPVVADPVRCTEYFSRERWTSFKEDVRFFRNIFRAEQWNQILQDHGYNATPVWALLGRMLSSSGPASRAQLLALTLLDSALLVIMWVAIIWAFGWRVACVGLIWWGTNYLARFYWNGGAFLRMDWLVLAMIGICLVRRGHPRAGGFALGYSALLRIFPAFIFAGLLVKVAVGSWRSRRWSLADPAARILMGGLWAVAILIPLAAMFSSGRPGLAAFSAFVENSRKHMDTPFTNSVGLKTIVAFEPATSVRSKVDWSLADPYGPWKEARKRVFEERKLLFLALLGGFLVLFVGTVARLPPWAALALSVGLIPLGVELSCYYFSFMLAFAFLWPRWSAIGALLAAAAAASCLVPLLSEWNDVHYVLFSGIVVAVATGAVWLCRTGGECSMSHNGADLCKG